MSAVDPRLLVADISDWQTRFDARAYARAGRRVVMVKQGEGTGDAGGGLEAAARVDAAHAVGLHVIHYVMARYDEDPDQTMRPYVVRVHPHWRAGDRMLLDIEAYSGSPDRAADWVRGAQHSLRSQGVPNAAMVYTNESYFVEAGPRLWNLTNWWHIAIYDGLLLGAGGEPKLPRGCKAHLLAKQYTDGAIGAEPHVAPGIGACDNSILTRAGAAYLAAPARRLKRRRV